MLKRLVNFLFAMKLTFVIL